MEIQSGLTGRFVWKILLVNTSFRCAEPGVGLALLHKAFYPQLVKALQDSSWIFACSVLLEKE
jgi:hypothetical protein